MALKVLIVDDSSVMRKIIEKTLQQAGIQLREVLQASNGSEALALVWNAPDLDVILCDYHMREMDGLAFVKEVRKLPKHAETPILIISTEGSLDKMQESQGAGVSGYLTKPFTAEKMKEMINKVVKTA